MSKKKWLTLSLVGTVLLLIPRRSSQKTSPDIYKPSAEAKQKTDNLSKKVANIDESKE